MTVNLVERKTETRKVTITFEVDLHGTEIDIREARNALDYISGDDYDPKDDTFLAECLADIITEHTDDSENLAYVVVSTSAISHEILKSA